MPRLVQLRGRSAEIARRAGLVLVLIALVEGLGNLIGVFDGSGHRVVYDGVLVGAALLLTARAVLIPGQRLAWAFMAGGLVLWTAADLYFTLAQDESAGVSYPSVSDAMFVACLGVSTIGVIALARVNLRGPTGLVLLDGLTAALATASLALALLWGPASDLIESGEAASAPAIAYPVCDFILVAFAAGMLVMSGDAWRRTWLLLAIGWGLAGTADLVHVYDAVAGGYEFGSEYDFIWPLSAVVIALAGWQVSGAVAVAPLRPGPMFAYPSLFALPALGVLVADHFARVGIVPLALATATIVLVFVRVAIALSQLATAHEAQLRMRERDAQSRRLESLGQLAGGVAHDFNNLLAVILNYAHMLAASLPPGDERRADAEEIGRTAERAATLSRRLLVFSRRDTALPELVEVPSALAAMEQMLRTTVGEDIRLELAAADELGCVLLGAGQLDQIVLNLAVNARDAMPEGGELSIRADVVPAGALPPELSLQPGRYVRLSVHDTGSGMSAEVQERAFEPFFSTKSIGHGTGLGLATVYGITERAGGAVEIRSNESDGTDVLVYLPAATEAPVAAGAPS